MLFDFYVVALIASLNIHKNNFVTSKTKLTEYMIFISCKLIGVLFCPDLIFDQNGDFFVNDAKNINATILLPYINT